MDTYLCTVCKLFEKAVHVEAESREEARKKLDGMLLSGDEKAVIDYENDCCDSWEELEKIVKDESEKEYVVLITEMLEKNVTVKARNKLEAELEARWRHANSEDGFVLMADDFTDCSFKVIGEKEKEK